MQPSTRKLITNFVITCVVAIVAIFGLMALLDIAASMYVRSTLDCKQFDNDLVGVIPKQCVGQTR